MYRNSRVTRSYSESYANNEAPNRTLKKLGFEFVEEYETTPTWVSFHQKTNKFKLSKEIFNIQLKTTRREI